MYLYGLMIYTDSLHVPLVQFVDTLINFNLMMPSKAMQLTYIRKFLHRAVWLRAIPLERALETDFSNNLLCTFLDCKFLSCSYIDVAVAYFSNAVAILNAVLVCVLEIYV